MKEHTSERKLVIVKEGAFACLPLIPVGAGDELILTEEPIVWLRSKRSVYQFLEERLTEWKS